VAVFCNPAQSYLNWFWDSDRNWLEFLSVLDATFSCIAISQDGVSPEANEFVRMECSENIVRTRDLFTRLAEEDGKKDRSALLALLELEKRARIHGLSTGR
jgi:N-terminal acetyltransferase B complex non-catalytic subunit